MPQVLIIDSEAGPVQSLRDALGAKGFQSTATGDGAEGLNLARSARPDVIVLCVELSRGSGYSVCNKLKKDGDLAAIPLILTSSQATDETFEQHKKLRTRAEAYIKKPFDAATVVAQIQQLVGGGAATQPASAEDELEVSVDELAVEEEQEPSKLQTTPGVKVPTSALPDDLDALISAPVATPKPAPMPASTTSTMKASSPLAASAGVDVEADVKAPRGTASLLSDAEAERMRSEIRQLRQKVQKLETTLQEKELEFNDRLLQESARAREAVDLKKKLGTIDRDVGKYQQLAEKAAADVERAKQDAAAYKRDLEAAEKEKQMLSDKLGQLVDKVKALAAERDQLNNEKSKLSDSMSGQQSEVENAAKVREKVKKAVDIALQLLQETNMASH